MVDLTTPAIVPNWVAGKERLALSGRTFEKVNPTTGRLLCRVAQSDERDVRDSVAAATVVQPNWASQTVTRRGEFLRATAGLMEQHRDEIAALVASETGKSRKDALGETTAAIEMGFFVAGRALSSRPTRRSPTSPGRYSRHCCVAMLQF